MSAIKTVSLQPIYHCPEDLKHQEYRELIHGQNVMAKPPVIVETWYEGYFVISPDEFKNKSAACKLTHIGYSADAGLMNKNSLKADARYYMIPLYEENAILQPDDSFVSTKRQYFPPENPELKVDGDKQKYFFFDHVPKQLEPVYRQLTAITSNDNTQWMPQDIFGHPTNTPTVGLSIYLYNPNSFLTPEFHMKNLKVNYTYESACFITFQGEGFASQQLKFLDGTQPAYTPNRPDYLLIGWKNSNGIIYPPDKLPLAGDQDITYTAVWRYKKNLYIGNKKTKDIYLGDAKIKEIYLGDKWFYKS